MSLHIGTSKFWSKVLGRRCSNISATLKWNEIKKQMKFSPTDEIERWKDWEENYKHNSDFQQIRIYSFTNVSLATSNTNVNHK